MNNNISIQYNQSMFVNSNASDHFIPYTYNHLNMRLNNVNNYSYDKLEQHKYPPVKLNRVSLKKPSSWLLLGVHASGNMTRLLRAYAPTRGLAKYGPIQENRRSVRSPNPDQDKFYHMIPLTDKETNKENQDKDKEESYICETNLHLTNAAAKELYQAIKQQYTPNANKRLHSLAWLHDLNDFLYDKIYEIYNDGTYLNNRIQFTDIMMVKKSIELAIENCIKAEQKVLIENVLSKTYFTEKKTVADFFPYYGKQINSALDSIDFQILREFLEFKNGITYEDAQKNLLELTTNKQNNQNETYREYHILLNLMQVAQHKYEKMLINDPIPLIDRIIYYNTREIYLSLLDNQPRHLRQSLIKRFFYYIFEYSRINGLSVQGNYVVVPGELTEYNSLFTPKPPLLTEQAIAELVTNQIVGFIHGSDIDHPHLDRLIRDIEYFRYHPYTPPINVSWREISMNPYNNTLQLLEKSVTTNLDRLDNPAFQKNSQWMGDLADQIKYDNECILLLSFVQKLQGYLVTTVEQHLHEQIQLGSKTDVQRFAEAKILAVIMAYPNESLNKSKNEILKYYSELIISSNIQCLVRAAAYWYIDYHKVETHKLGEMNALFIIKEFLEGNRLLALDFENRIDLNLMSIFDLKSSNLFDSPTKFYEQFIHYKEFVLRQEAKKFTNKIVLRSGIDYLDIIYPPKYIYTFKIYSRNYIPNSLSPNTDIYAPNNNFGTFSLICTYSHKIIIASTLFSAPFIKEIAASQNEDLIKHIIEEHKLTNFKVNWINRKKIPISSDDLEMLFDITPDNNKLRMSPLNIFLIEPEENILVNPKPEYVLVAGDEEKNHESLLAYVDYWNEQTLLEIVNQLKLSLREKKWWQELLALIPFYETTWKYWHDADNTFNGIEIIFDTFDLAFMLAQLTKSAAKGSGVLYKRIINIRELESMPIKRLNQIISEKLIEELPRVARKSSGSLVNSVLGYLNPVPLDAIFSVKVKQHLNENMATVISWLSNFVLNNMEKRTSKFILWSSDINKSYLSHKDGDGIYRIRNGQETTQSFIKIDDNFFQVIWDMALKSWRVVKPTEVINENYAVPVFINDKGRWIASSFLDNDKLSMSTHSGRKSRYVEKRINYINIEPLRSVVFAKEKNHENSWLYVYMLEIMLDLYVPHIKILFENNSDLSKILTDFVACLTDVNKLEEIFFDEDEKDTLALLRHFTQSLQLVESMSFRYRMQRSWRDEHDMTPVDHILLVLRLRHHTYVIDIKYLRPFDSGLLDDRQVYDEPEWVKLSKQTLSRNYPLIKYKDFKKLSGALAFPYREAEHPGKTIAGAFLLREPIWYKTLAIKYYFRYNKGKFAESPDDPSAILTACRNLIASYHHSDNDLMYNIKMSFPYVILEKARQINHKEYEEMRHNASLAFGHHHPHQGYFSSSKNMIEFQDLLQLKAGKIIAFYYDQLFLSHLMLSMGMGRFAGIGNNFFNPQFGDGPSIILAEEMGPLTGGKLKIRNTNETYTVIAGNPVNIPNDKLFMPASSVSQMASVLVPEDTATNDSEQRLAREKALTQDGWTLSLSTENPYRLDLKLFASPLSLYPLDTNEMAHIVRGLIYANPALPSLESLQNIRLISIFDGSGNLSHRGQSLANELQIPVQIRPYLETESIRQRQPQWFFNYLPMPSDLTITDADYDSKENGELKLKIKNLSTMLEMLITIRKSLSSARIKREMNSLPGIFSDLARLIIRDINFYDFTGSYNKPDEEDEKRLYDILKDYEAYFSDSDEYFLQCFFDILLSVKYFHRLANMIYPMLSSTQNNTAPLWPYT